MDNYFQAKPNKPAHLSIGAVVLNADNKVMAHYHAKIGPATDVYTLARETMEVGERIEDTLARGLLEEAGVKAEVITYIGSKTANDTWFGEINQPTTVQKTTLYFVMRLVSMDAALRAKDDPESGSEIQWLDFDDLAKKMQEQAVRLKFSDIDESDVLARVQDFLKAKQ